jgi:putative restriction endonuclease
MPIWTDAAVNAIRRHIARTGSAVFTRQAIMAEELSAASAETRTVGKTPAQTFTRELQQLRKMGLLEFVDRGKYRWLGPMPKLAPTTASKGVFLIDAVMDAQPERSFRFGPEWSDVAVRLLDQWIVYQSAPDGQESGYCAVAEVASVDPATAGAPGLIARIKEGSYLEFGRIVPLWINGVAIEHALNVYGADRDQALRSVRAISDAEFNRIVELGLVTEDELLPRTDADEEPFPMQIVSDEQSGWDDPVDRTTMLVSRTVRDRQFRKRVLDAYGARCALTGMNLINGGGRAETQAAHIKSVEAGGPDKVNNGIALSGTIHWMFDRGLISLSDSGNILLSRAINDRESVERLIYPDRRARLPAKASDQPDPQYLHWHRTVCFHD